MNMPGFSADASIYKTKERYYSNTASSFGTFLIDREGSSRIQAQLLRTIGQPTGPSGNTIRRPGRKDCFGTCRSFCSSFGEGLGGRGEQWWQPCMNTCTTFC